jgi:hypothetical protein
VLLIVSNRRKPVELNGPSPANEIFSETRIRSARALPIRFRVLLPSARALRIFHFAQRCSSGPAQLTVRASAVAFQTSCARPVRWSKDSYSCTSNQGQRSYLKRSDSLYLSEVGLITCVDRTLPLLLPLVAGSAYAACSGRCFLVCASCLVFSVPYY